MSLESSIQPVSTLKTRSAELIRQAQESGEPVVITQNGRATAVLVDIQTYEREREALRLLRLLAQGEAEIRQGKGLEEGDVRARLQARFKARSSG